jgi:voltage-gated potassium channel
MRRRLRVAWYSTVVLLPVTALQGVLQSIPLSVPLIVLSILAMPNVLYNRKQFDRAVELTTAQLAAGAAILGAQIYKRYRRMPRGLTPGLNPIGRDTNH